MPQEPTKSVADQALLDMLVAADLEANPPDKAEPTARKLDGVSKGLLIGGNVADLGSTLYALNNGARETNPLYGDHPSAAKLLAVKGAGTLLQYILLNKFAKHHPTAANRVAKAIGAGLGGVSAWNLSQVKKD